MPLTVTNLEIFDTDMELFRKFDTNRITTESINSETLTKTGFVPKQNDTEGQLFRMLLNKIHIKFFDYSI